MVIGTRVCTCFILSIALTGCAANDLMLKRQAESEARVEQLIQSGKKAEVRINELADQVQAWNDNAKSAAVQLKQTQETIRELRASQDELKARMTLLSQQPSSPKIEVVNQEPAPKGKDSGPPSEYLKAFGLYSANNFQNAIAAFETFIKNNPQSDYDANALYWIGECHYSLSDLPKAREVFSRVAESYPNSTKVPDALLKLGFTLAAMKEKDKAHAIFEKLIKSYPGSPAASKARERLSAN
jgi:tol-pal system protein YbgF